MRVALVHDWFVNAGGAESVVEQILEIYPNADLFAIIDFLPKGQRNLINNKNVNTSFIQKIPFAKKFYRLLLPLMPLAVEQFNLSNYDLVISSSSCVAKGVLTSPNQLHICYCHTPMRYAWSDYFDYIKNYNLYSSLKNLFVKFYLHKIRIWDIISNNRINKFIANSSNVKNRIKKYYNRSSIIIYPPVDTNFYNQKLSSKEDFYITVSRLVKNKKVDLIVDTFLKNYPNKKLIVIGDGPELKILKKKANSNINFLGYQSKISTRDYLSRAKAFIFASHEDFGIVTVEAQSCGTPVIAYGKGGSLETVNNLNHTYPTGIFFYNQTIEDLSFSIQQFEKNINKFFPKNCILKSNNFTQNIFKKEFKKYVDAEYLKYLNKQKKFYLPKTD